ncbi:MAG: hypothetical protein TRG1_2334 [Flavobacteriaceae bacterium FS1-H7996/R]|nr:MAG: hypothetical protein TRG1_2334 [Flavobacteriaceae bacterium FS1-H7996/R]
MVTNDYSKLKNIKNKLLKFDRFKLVKTNNQQPTTNNNIEWKY